MTGLTPRRSLTRVHAVLNSLNLKRVGHPVTEHPDAGHPVLEARPNLVGGFVERVELRLAELLGEGERGLRAPAPLVEAARHLCLAGGKRVRPRLVEAFAEAVGVSSSAPGDGAGEGLVGVAVAVELMHAASLLHDDVVDGGTLRRGRETVNARWGNTVAVLSGDLLLSAALSELRPRVSSPIAPAASSSATRLRLVADAVDVVLSMTQAAMNEVAARWRIDLGLAAWRAIAEGKTGVLFGFCGHAAALLAGDEEAAARHRRCGHHLGVAFQLTDDLDDLLPSGAGPGSGKDRYADVRNGNPSYPLLLAAARSPSLHAMLEEAWAEREEGTGVAPEAALAIGDAVLASGAAADTHRAIGEEIAAAQVALGDERSGPASARIFEQARALWRRAGVEMEACAAI